MLYHLQNNLQITKDISEVFDLSAILLLSHSSKMLLIPNFNFLSASSKKKNDRKLFMLFEASNIANFSFFFSTFLSKVWIH